MLWPIRSVLLKKCVALFLLILSQISVTMTEL